MTPIHIFATHGIQNGIMRRAAYPHEWSEGLLDPSDADPVLAHIYPGPWNSHGSGVADVANWALSRTYRDECDEAVADSLVRFERVSRNRPRVVVCHSGGCAVVPSAMRKLRARGHAAGWLNVVMIGNPWTHPLFGRGLDRIWDRNTLPLEDVVAFSNLDDSICAVRGWMRDVDFMHTQMVAVPGNGKWQQEHGAQIYLRHPNVRAAIVTRATAFE